MKRIYLDTCVWCRPFDQPTNEKIALEAAAVKRLISRVDSGEIVILGSSVLLLETSLVSPESFMPITIGTTMNENKYAGTFVVSPSSSLRTGLSNHERPFDKLRASG